MTDRPRISLEQLVTGWDETATEHRRALGDGWPIAREFLQLHGEAVEAVSKVSGNTPNVSDEAVILLGCHGFNICVGAVALIVRGQFDVVSYLMRGLIDCWSLLWGVGVIPDLADRFLSDRLSGAETRQLLVKLIEERGGDDAEIADELNQRLKGDADASNSLSHVSSVHADKLVTIENGSITPQLGGHVDSEQARLLMAGVLEQEHWMLTALHAVRPQALRAGWQERFRGTTDRWLKWTKEVQAG